MAVSEEWARTIAKYPERYGKLSGIFYHLMKEIIEAKAVPDHRIAFYMTCIKTIDSKISNDYGVDNHASTGYDCRKLTTESQVQGVNQMEEE
jgi:hypothetical protein